MARTRLINHFDNRRCATAREIANAPIRKIGLKSNFSCRIARMLM